MINSLYTLLDCQCLTFVEDVKDCNDSSAYIWIYLEANSWKVSLFALDHYHCSWSFDLVNCHLLLVNFLSMTIWVAWRRYSICIWHISIWWEIFSSKLDHKFLGIRNPMLGKSCMYLFNHSERTVLFWTGSWCPVCLNGLPLSCRRHKFIQGYSRDEVHNFWTVWCGEINYE